MWHAFYKCNNAYITLHDYMHACIMYIDLLNTIQYYSCVPACIIMMHIDTYILSYSYVYAHTKLVHYHWKYIHMYKT